MPRYVPTLTNFESCTSEEVAQHDKTPFLFISFVSKIVEHLAIRRFNHHVSTLNLLTKYLSAHSAYYYTETIISVVVCNEIARTVRAGQLCTMVLLNFSAAFD